MEQLLYERPREKLQNRGASYLTTVELLQIIIGSGTAAVSGARLAKRVSQILLNNAPSLSSLCQVEGIGLAKASQIIAALELGRRLLPTSSPRQVSVDKRLIMKRIGVHRKLVLIAYFFDGNNTHVSERVYSLQNLGAAQLSQQLARDALESNARSVVLVLGSRKDSLQTTAYELDLIKHCKESLGLLLIRLAMVYRASAVSIESWSEL